MRHCDDSESKQRFKALRHHQVATGPTQLCTKASTDNMKTNEKRKKRTNECGCVPIKLYLQTLITEFHLFSYITKHYSSFDVTV